MKLVVDHSVFEKFLGVTLGVVIVKNCNNTARTEELQNKLRFEEKRIQESFQPDTLSQHPFIDVWRKAYTAFGAKPKEHKSSVENLYRLVLGGKEVRSINTLVDLYNYISLKYMLPVGGEDTDIVVGDIHLAIASENEPSVLLLGDKEPRTPHVGEVIYKDDTSAICRRWNWREADRTKLTESTKNAILVIEALPPISRDVLEHAIKELKGLVEQFCGGNIAEHILDQEYPFVEIGN